MQLTKNEIKWIKNKYAEENQDIYNNETIKQISSKYQDEKDSLMSDKGEYEDAKNELKKLKKLDKLSNKDITRKSELKSIMKSKEEIINRYNEIMTLQYKEIVSS